MQSPHGISRVILVVLDGIRSDAVPLLPLPGVRALAERGAHTFLGATVEPSVTAAAVASLFTGVPPEIHGIRSERFGVPRPRRPLTVLPQLLQRHGYQTRGHMAAVPRAFRGVAARITAQVGAEVTFAGATAAEILAQATASLRWRRRGLLYLHWPDADRAGHDSGWMSPGYAAAARRVDHSLERLVEVTGVLDDPETVVIALADHGGGGTDPCDHDSRHPLDMTIPIVLAGGQVRPGLLPHGASLLDVAATIPWLLGIEPPESFAGRPLHEAIAPESTAGDLALAGPPTGEAA